MATVPQSAQELFNEQVPNAIAKAPDKAREIGAIYLFKITGDGGGEWTVDLASAEPSCKAGTHGAAQCTIEVTHDDFKAMLGNPAMGMQLYFQGKLKVTGDPMLATKLQKLFSMGA
ncbi:MAG: SCP2 sterol-binding domain-containing protein [Myxococcales bacterium]|nr:SCP2 sterol-binding domain-containing protein [Myxococcales bacterium]